MAKPSAPIDLSYTGPRPPVSVVILTLNEEINITPCLASCVWSDDVHVLDSGSTDRTRECTAAARVLNDAPVGWHVNPFKSFGAQRNWAIDHIPLAHPWVFHLDADERFTPALVAEIAALLNTNPPHAGFYVANQMILMGRWIKRASGYPAYQMRLFHKDRMRFSDHGHGQRELTTGTIGTLREPYLHHNFSKGLDDWLARHNRYSSAEVAQILADAEGSGSVLAGLIAGGIQRRRALKRLFHKLPFRGSIRWWYTMLAQGAMFDGRAGRTYADLLRVYEQMIAIKLRERRAARTHEPRDPARTTHD